MPVVISYSFILFCFWTRSMVLEVLGYRSFCIFIFAVKSFFRQKHGHTPDNKMPPWLNWQSSWFVISRLAVRVRPAALRSGLEGFQPGLISRVMRVRVPPPLFPQVRPCGISPHGGEIKWDALTGRMFAIVCRQRITRGFHRLYRRWNEYKHLVRRTRW